MSLWCWHGNKTTPRRDEQGEYRRCLECGARLAWTWPDKFPIRPPHRAEPSSREVFARSLDIEDRTRSGLSVPALWRRSLESFE